MWTIILEDENGIELSIISKELSLPSSILYENFKLLKYLDPYGDTVFNRLQMHDLILDFEKLKEDNNDPIIDEIISLAKCCIDNPHSYLKFYGD